MKRKTQAEIISLSPYKRKIERQQKAKADKETKLHLSTLPLRVEGKKAQKKRTKRQPPVSRKLNISSSSKSECSADVDDTSSSGNSGSDSEDNGDCQFCE